MIALKIPLLCLDFLSQKDKNDRLVQRPLKIFALLVSGSH